MNLVGELVLTRNQVLQFNAAHDDTVLNGITHRLNLITAELQERVMKTRMQPIGRIFNQFPRVVRDLATSLEQADHAGNGGRRDGTRPHDRRGHQGPAHPHRAQLLRSRHRVAARSASGKASRPADACCCALSTKAGRSISKSAMTARASIPQRIRAKTVERGMLTAGTSGAPLRSRGGQPGLPAGILHGASGHQSLRARRRNGRRTTHIEGIGGTVELLSRPGEGTTLLIRIPLTLAIVPGLLVNAGGERFVIPQLNLHELIRLEGDAARTAIEYVHATPVLRRRNALLPLADLCHVLRLPERRQPDELNIVVVQVDGRRFGLVVDAINDTEEIVVKPLWQQLKNLNCYAGATIMGDGGIALILDVAGIGLRSGVTVPAGQMARAAEPAKAAGQRADPLRSLLLLRAGGFKRLAMPLAKVARLENIPAAQVEFAAGRSVVQYRNRVLPLVSVAQMLEGAPSPETEVLQAVVYRDGVTDIGLVVDEIVDIVEETREQSGGDRPSGFAGLRSGGRAGDRLSGSRCGGAVGGARRHRIAGKTGSGALHRRAAAGRGGDAMSTLYATFLVAGHYLGIDVLEMQEVLRGQRLTPVPLAPEVVEGLINLRGQIVPAIDLRRVLKLAPADPGQDRFSVVARSDHGPVSLQVDEIGDVVELDDGRIRAAARQRGPCHRLPAARRVQVERPFTARAGHRPGHRDRPSRHRCGKQESK